jgi:hypothetical protein
MERFADKSKTYSIFSTSHRRALIAKFDVTLQRVAAVSQSYYTNRPITNGDACRLRRSITHIALMATTPSMRGKQAPTLAITPTRNNLEDRGEHKRWFQSVGSSRIRSTRSEHRGRQGAPQSAYRTCCAASKLQRPSVSVSDP